MRWMLRGISLLQFTSHDFWLEKIHESKKYNKKDYLHRLPLYYWECITYISYKKISHIGLLTEGISITKFVVFFCT